MSLDVALSCWLLTQNMMDFPALVIRGGGTAKNGTKLIKSMETQHVRRAISSRRTRRDAVAHDKARRWCRADRRWCFMDLFSYKSAPALRVPVRIWISSDGNRLLLLCGGSLKTRIYLIHAWRNSRRNQKYKLQCKLAMVFIYFCASISFHLLPTSPFIVWVIC